MLQGWGLEKEGLDPEKCYVFLRTSFGSLIYFHDEDYYFLSPFIARNALCGGTFKKLIIRTLAEEPDLNLIYWLDLHKKVYNEMPQLQEDEIYTIVPSIPEGGSPESSTVEIVKMKEQLSLLSELYDHEVTED